MSSESQNGEAIASKRLSLVYGSCWEDPDVDRKALKVQPTDTVVCIASAGCNAFCYLLDQPDSIYAVDLNLTQVYLVNLKQACIRELDYATAFRMLGEGYEPSAKSIYRSKLREKLDPPTQAFWDRWIKLFAQPKRGFYLHGGVGRLIRRFQTWLAWNRRTRQALFELFDCQTTDDQVDHYRRELRRRFWKPPVRFLLNRRWVLSKIGIPGSQVQLGRNVIRSTAEFLDKRTEELLSRQLVKDNPYWQLFLFGKFRTDCCPRFLREDCFSKLQSGLIERLKVKQGTLESFCAEHRRRFDKFVLMDTMDWMADSEMQLSKQWQAVLESSKDGAMYVWRSMGDLQPIIDNLRVKLGTVETRLMDQLSIDVDECDSLLENESANTYWQYRVARLQRTPNL